MNGPASPSPSWTAPVTAEQWSAAQAAAVATAEAIAATAAAEVAAEAAVTARAAVCVASAAATKAAAKATEVAAQAVLAAAAAAVERPYHLPPAEQAALSEAPATAAAKVASCVSAVAAAASKAAVEASAVIGDQLAVDIAAAAVAVTFAANHPALPHDASVSPVPDAGPAAGPVSASQAAAPALSRAERRLAEELHRGIEGGELRLHYQPIMHAASGRAVGVEALVRWQHPVRGLLGPLAFIGLAERTGLIRPLGEWVLYEACRMAVTLQDRDGSPVTVAVNVSGRQASDRGLVATVRAALRDTGCSGERLVFEVTETAQITDMAAAVDSLRQLRELGAGVAIDDFGTGYAPLTYLKHLAADDLKIDMSFVAGLGSDSYDTAIVESLISLAHSLNVRCVAEGVETAEQLELLQQLGCDFTQGSLFCRPVDAPSLAGWLDGLAPEEVPSVRAVRAAGPEDARIRAMHASGTSLLTIAASLNSDGSRTIRGRRWSAQTVARTLA